MTALLIAAAMTVSLSEGKVTLATGAKVEQGAELHSGDTVETGPDARVEIALPSGSVLRLGENSRVTLGDAVPQKAFRARLLLGNLWARVHKLVAAESFHIETENGVAGVRGTEFRVEVAQGQEDLVRVYEGAVQVDAHDGKWSARVEPGTELRFHKDRAPAGVHGFDVASEKGHKFMDWVRGRPSKESPRPGEIHRREEERREEKKERKGIHKLLHF